MQTWGLEISLKLLTNLRARLLREGREHIQKLSFRLQKAIKGCEGRTATGFVKAEDFYGLGAGSKAAIKIADCSSELFSPLTL